MAQFGPAMATPLWRMVMNLLMVGKHLMHAAVILLIHTDDPESRMLYEHHGENELMMTTFMNVRNLPSTFILNDFCCMHTQQK